RERGYAHGNMRSWSVYSRMAIGQGFPVVYALGAWGSCHGCLPRVIIQLDCLRLKTSSTSSFTKPHSPMSSGSGHIDPFGSWNRRTFENFSLSLLLTCSISFFVHLCSLTILTVRCRNS